MTDAPRPPAWWQRHDLLVIAAAAVVLLAGAVVHRVLTAPGTVPFERAGLAFERPTGFLPPVQVDVAPSAFAALAGDPARPRRDDGIHESLQRAGSRLGRLEVQVGKRPTYRNLAMSRQLERQTRYGPYYWAAETAEREIAGHTWHRAEFRYAVEPTADDAPRVATGIEYATVNDDRLYVVTFHGAPDEARWLEQAVATTLRVN